MTPPPVKGLTPPPVHVAQSRMLPQIDRTYLVSVWFVYGGGFERGVGRSYPILPPPLLSIVIGCSLLCT